MKRSNIFWGIVLVLAAVLLLLRNLEIINDFFGYFWTFALLLVGIWLIFGAFRRSQKGKGEHVTVPLDNASCAHLKLDHGAGRLLIHSGAAPGFLLDGDFAPSPILKTFNEDGTLTVKIKNVADFWTWAPGEGRNWDFALTTELPMKLDIDSGASTAIIDLHDLKVIALDLDTGASTTDLTLPANAGNTQVKIDSGAATVNVHIPDNVAAQIRIESGMASIHVNERFQKISKNLYISPDYANAANRVDLNIETGVASVNIN